MKRTFSVGNAILSAILIASAVALLWAVPGDITGKLIETVAANLSIMAVDDGAIIDFSRSPGYEIDQYSRMNLSVEFRNTGSTSYTARIEIYALDYNLTNISRMLGGYNYMKPDSRISYSTRYIPQLFGFQWIHIVVPYAANKKAEAWALIYVKPYYYQWPQTPGNGTEGSGTGAGGGGGTAGGGGGGGRMTAVAGDKYEMIIPSVPAADTGTVGFQISYPKRAELVPGGSSAIYVVANNTGTMILRDMRFTGYITGARMDVAPKMIYALPGKSSAVFMISLEVPEDIAPDTYLLDFRIQANVANASGHIDLDIRPGNAQDELNQTILNYRYIISRMEDEAEALKILGRNTTLASDYLDEAKAALKQAKDGYEKGEIDSAKNSLKRVKRLLLLAASEIALARSVGLFIALSPAYLLLFILIAAAIIAGIAVYVHKRKKEIEEKEKEKEKTA